MFNYSLRGTCRQASEEAAKKDASLRVVRGYYHCWEWGRQPHWWCVRENGEIVDPTKNQFPSLGNAEYEEFDEWFKCSECGKSIREEDGIIHGNYIFCCDRCCCRFVGL